MKKISRMRRLLQYLALGTQYPPFIWIHRTFYELCVHFCTRRLRAIEGVRSIFLRRGLASERPLYGLSDIDLLVVIKEEESKYVAAKVSFTYEWLCRLVPMLPREELAVYTLDEFHELHTHSPFHRYRFEQGRHGWRRLYGEDIFKNLPSADHEKRTLVIEELTPAWNHLVEAFLRDNIRPNYQRGYTAYKAIAEAAKAAIVAGGLKGPEISRDTALDLAGNFFQEIGKSLKELQNWRNHLISWEPISEDRLLELFFYLGRSACSSLPRGTQTHHELRLNIRVPEEKKWFLAEENISEIEKACADLDGIERAVFIPRLSFSPIATLGLDPESLVGATTDALDLILIGKKLPASINLREFIRKIDAFYPMVNPFFCDGEVAVTLRSAIGRSFKNRGNSPELFACISSTKHLKGVLEIGDSVELIRPMEKGDLLESRANTLFNIFRKRDVFRLPVRSFFTLFWEAGRAACLMSQWDRKVKEVPVSAEQILHILMTLTPDEADVLEQIYVEYARLMRDESSELVRYVNWSALYIAKLEDQLFNHLEGEVELLENAKATLTISVLIVTRNRAELIGRALQSLVEQERTPEEVVVVDNASTDATLSIVRSFAKKLNLKVIQEDTIGVPHARNAGLRQCKNDVVAVMDDDCIADSRWLAELEVPFLKDPHIGAVGGLILPVQENDNMIARFYNSHMVT